MSDYCYLNKLFYDSKKLVNIAIRETTRQSNDSCVNTEQKKPRGWAIINQGAHCTALHGTHVLAMTSNNKLSKAVMLLLLAKSMRIRR